MSIYKNIERPVKLTNTPLSEREYNSQFAKYKRIEQLILNCALNGSNLTRDPLSWEILTLRLNGLKSFINQVIYTETFNAILHSQIDNILTSKDFKQIYENYKSN